MQRSARSDRQGDEWDEWQALLRTLLPLIWTSNPQLLADEVYRSVGVFTRVVDLLFEPLVSRYSTEDELRIDQRSQADLLFALTSPILLLLQIHQTKGIGRLSEDDKRQLSDPSLLYEHAAQHLLLQMYGPGWRRRRRKGAFGLNFRPIDDEHRHQQRTLTRLALNHFHTATRGLPDPQADATATLTAQQRQHTVMLQTSYHPELLVVRSDLHWPSTSILE